MLNLSRAEVREYLIIAAAFLAISLVFFWPMLQHITFVVPGTGGDVYQSMWDLWWVPYSIFTLGSTPYLTYYLYYPVGASLAAQTLAPIAGIVSYIFQSVSVAFSYNIIFLLGFVLSGLFTYMLAYHVTKNRLASFIAGFIYAFSPIHTIQAFGHLQYTNIEFIPLFLLFFLRMLEERKHRYAILAGISFVLLTFMGDIEQGLMSILLALFILLYFLVAKSHRHKLLNKKFMTLLAELAATFIIVGSPAIVGILGALTPQTLSSVNTQATTAYNELYSPDLLSFLIPSSFNGPLSFAANAAAGINAPAPAERTTYVGFTILLLLFLLLRHEYAERFKNTGIFLLPLTLFFLLSLGPSLQINGNITGIPGLYQLYHIVPLFNVLREPGRFDIVVELLLAVLAAMSIEVLEKKYSHRINKRYLAIAFLALLVIEYNSFPTSSHMLAGMYSNATIPKAYAEMGAIPGNFSILLLPAIPNFTSRSPEMYPGLAMYYQTAFRKPLVGGYTTRSNTTQLFSLVNVPLVSASYYLETGQGLVYASPVVENYTNQTRFLLGAYGVGFVAVMRQAYNQTQLQDISSYLASFLGYPQYINASLNTSPIIFSTKNLVSLAGKTAVAYTPVLFGSVYSLWQPGWVLCGASQYCNSTYANLWFATNPAYINFYVPNYTKMNISMQAFAPIGFHTEYAYLNNKLAGTLNLTPAPRRFSIVTELNPGINQLILLSTGANNTSYSNIGIVNITFKEYS